MEVFRLTRKKYAAKLSGKGAALKGARWNSPGREVIYTAANRSLAMAEVAVYYNFATLPRDYQMLTIHIPDSGTIKSIGSEGLPTSWNAFPHSKETQVAGDAFLEERKFLTCRVPSVVTQGDFNYLINPHHPGFASVQIIDCVHFLFDQRLFA